VKHSIGHNKLDTKQEVKDSVKKVYLKFQNFLTEE
jgi:hypothetical protein